MSEYEKGVQHHKNGGTIGGQQDFKAEFINGFHEQERRSKCGFTYNVWHSFTQYKAL